MLSEADNLRDRSRADAARLTPAALRVDFTFPPSSQPRSSQPAFGGARNRLRQLQTQSAEPQSTPPPKSKDGLMPIAEQETPQIAKNRAMRDGHPSQQQAQQQPPPAPSSSAGSMLPPQARRPTVMDTPGHSRRRSSLSMRGKRVSASYENSGIISACSSLVSDFSYIVFNTPN